MIEQKLKELNLHPDLHQLCTNLATKMLIEKNIQPSQWVSACLIIAYIVESIALQTTNKKPGELYGYLKTLAEISSEAYRSALEDKI